MGADAKLQGVIGLDTGPFSKALNLLPGMASRTSGKVSSSFRGIGMALAAVGAATAAVTVKAVKMAAGFEKGMAEVETIFGGTADQLDMLKDKTLALGRAMGENTTVLTRALYQTISAGITDAADATLVLEKATIFAKAALVDTETSVDVLTTVLNSYNLSAEKAEHVSNVLFETIRLGKLRGEELAASLGRVTSIAATAGITFEELSATIAAATQRGLRADVAITGLRATILAILKPSKEATDLAKALGIEWNAAALKAKGLRGMMADLEEKTKDTTWAKKQLTAATADFNRLVAREIAGEKGLTKALKESAKEMQFLKGIIDGTLQPATILAGSARALAVFLAAARAEAEKGTITANFEAMMNSAGAAQTAAEIMMDTIDHKWAVLTANMEQAMIRFGASVLPVLTKVLNKVNEVFDDFDTLSAQAKKVGVPGLGFMEVQRIQLGVEAERYKRFYTQEFVKNPKTGKMEPRFSEAARKMFPDDPRRYYTIPERVKGFLGFDDPGTRDLKEEVEKIIRERIGFDDPKQQPGTLGDLPGRLRFRKKFPKAPLLTDERIREMELMQKVKEGGVFDQRLGIEEAQRPFAADEEYAARDERARQRVRNMMLEDAAMRDDPISTTPPDVDIPTGIRRGGRRKGPRGMPFPKDAGDTNININITGVIDEKMVEKLIKDIERYAKRKGGKGFRVESDSTPAAPPTGVR